MIVYYQEIEYDLITELSKEFYDKGRIYNDDNLANKFRWNYKKVMRIYLICDVIFNVALIGVNIILLAEAFNNLF